LLYQAEFLYDGIAIFPDNLEFTHKLFDETTVSFFEAIQQPQPGVIHDTVYRISGTSKEPLREENTQSRISGPFKQNFCMTGSLFPDNLEITQKLFVETTVSFFDVKQHNSIR
jgi:hypothetical protein